MTRLLDLNAESAKRSEERVLAALEKLDGALKERRFLVGDRFSRADLTACALLLQYCAPDKSDAQVSAAVPAYVCAVRDKHKNRPFFGWVLDSYRDHRRPLGDALR